MNEVPLPLRQLLQRMQWRGIIGGVLLAVAAIGGAQTSRIDLRVRPVWSGMPISRHTPCYAEIENNGVDTDGALSEVSAIGGLNIDYPVELPSGARKRVLVFSTGYGTATFQLRTRFGDIKHRMEVSYGSGSSNYGLISDNPDDLILMRGNSKDSSDQGGVQTGGCKPDEAPDRITAYSCLDVLVLGEGTERLSDVQVSAIKQYVKSGGGLIFIGGVAKSASTDSRWNDIRPAANLSLANRTLNGEAVTELTGTAAPWAKRVSFEMGQGWTTDYGLGSVGMLSVNPFESPVRTYSGRRAMMLRVAERNRGAAAGGFVGPYLEVSNPTMTSMGTLGSDPFEITAPSSGSLAWIVLAYIVAVIPVNFLILRKLKRVELAWVTVPIISVLFSLVLLRSTIGLYKASASTRTRAVIALDGRGGEGVVMARSEMFFPNADSHDLKLVNCDGTYRPQVDNDFRYYSNDQADALNFVDNGRSLVAPTCNTTNLAFREFTFLQTTDALKGIRCDAVRTNSGYSLTITNNSQYQLEGVNAVTRSTRLAPISKITPGQSAQLTVSNSQFQTNPNQNGDQSLRVANNQTLPIYVHFQVVGIRVGPGWGSAHPGSISTAVIHPVLSRGQL